MNRWVKILLAGVVLVPIAATFNVLGITRNQDSLVYLSMGASLAGGILFLVGLIGFLATRRRTVREEG
ncbi:MAG: hypothetical protein ABIS18_11450 [Actinomycetota bacterium]